MRVLLYHGQHDCAKGQDFSRMYDVLEYLALKLEHGEYDRAEVWHENKLLLLYSIEGVEP